MLMNYNFKINKIVQKHIVPTPENVLGQGSPINVFGRSHNLKSF